MKRFNLLLGLVVALVAWADPSQEGELNEQVITRSSQEGLTREVIFKNPVFVSRTEEVPRFGPHPSCGVTGGERVCEDYQDQECRSESDFHCWDSPRQRCETYNDRQCRTVPGDPICRNVPRNHCWTDYENRCRTIPGREVCRDTPHQVCENVTKQVCRDHTEWRCPAGVPPGGPGCTPVTRQRCENVTERVCRNETRRECHQESPRQECQREAVQRCETRQERQCNEGPSRQECQDIPRQRCDTVYEQECGYRDVNRCYPVTRERCFNTPIVNRSCEYLESVVRQVFSHYDADTTWTIEFPTDAPLNSSQTEQLKITRQGVVTVVKSPYRYDQKIVGSRVILTKKRVSLTDVQAFQAKVERANQDFTLTAQVGVFDHTEEAKVMLTAQFLQGSTVITSHLVRLTRRTQTFSVREMAVLAALPTRTLVTARFLVSLEAPAVHPGFRDKQIANIITPFALNGHQLDLEQDLQRLPVAEVLQINRNTSGDINLTVKSDRRQASPPSSRLVLEVLIESRRSLWGTGLGRRWVITDRKMFQEQADLIKAEIRTPRGDRVRTTVRAGLSLQGEMPTLTTLLSQREL